MVRCELKKYMKYQRQFRTKSIVIKDIWKTSPNLPEVKDSVSTPGSVGRHLVRRYCSFRFHSISQIRCKTAGSPNVFPKIMGNL